MVGGATAKPTGELVPPGEPLDPGLAEVTVTSLRLVDDEVYTGAREAFPP